MQDRKVNYIMMFYYAGQSLECFEVLRNYLTSAPVQ
jgi:hypothetical protein